MVTKTMTKTLCHYGPSLSVLNDNVVDSHVDPCIPSIINTVKQIKRSISLDVANNLEDNLNRKKGESEGVDAAY